MKAWKLREDGQSLEVYDLDPRTQSLKLKHTLKFNRQMGFEEAVSFVRSHPLGSANDKRDK